MVEQTGAAGVVVGRGCLGRPWLFRDLAAAFGGTDVQTLPSLGEVRTMMRRHAELLCEHMGEERGCKEFRKHVSWYLKGFRAGGTLRHSLALVDSLAALDGLLAELDPDEPFPVAELGSPRGRQGSPASPRGAARGLARRRRRAGSARPGGHLGDHRRLTRSDARRSPRGVTGNTPESFTPDSDSLQLVCLTRASCPFRYQTRDGPSPVSNSKGSALWHTIATSGKPMPAACPEPPSWPSRSPFS